MVRLRGPDNGTVSKITAPTLLVGGTVDTLFPLDEDARVYRLLKLRGTPVKMFWFCGGHGQCAEGNGGEKGAGLDVGSILGSGGGDARLEAASAAWLARYLKGDRSVRHRPGLRVPLGRRQVPRGPAISGAPRQARQGQRVGHAGDRAGRDLRRRPAATAVAGGAINVPVTVAGRANFSGRRRSRSPTRHWHARHHACVCAARERRPRGGGGQPVGPDPREARRQGTHDLPAARPDRLHRKAGARYQLQLVAGSAIWAGSAPREH